MVPPARRRRSPDRARSPPRGFRRGDPIPVALKLLGLIGRGIIRLSSTERPLAQVVVVDHPVAIVADGPANALSRPSKPSGWKTIQVPNRPGSFSSARSKGRAQGLPVRCERCRSGLPPPPPGHWPWPGPGRSLHRRGRQRAGCPCQSGQQQRPGRRMDVPGGHSDDEPTQPARSRMMNADVLTRIECTRNLRQGHKSGTLAARCSERVNADVKPTPVRRCLRGGDRPDGWQRRRDVAGRCACL